MTETEFPEDGPIDNDDGIAPIHPMFDDEQAPQSEDTGPDFGPAIIVDDQGVAKVTSDPKDLASAIPFPIHIDIVDVIVTGLRAQIAETVAHLRQTGWVPTDPFSFIVLVPEPLAKEVAVRTHRYIERITATAFAQTGRKPTIDYREDPAYTGDDMLVPLVQLGWSWTFGEEEAI